MSERKCTNCGRGEPDVWFISSSGGWCIACMGSIDHRRIPKATSRQQYQRRDRLRPRRERATYKCTIYTQRWRERAAGVPEDRLTPLPAR